VDNLLLRELILLRKRILGGAALALGTKHIAFDKTIQ
jgi:hypothetical protein